MGVGSSCNLFSQEHLRDLYMLSRSKFRQHVNCYSSSEGLHITMWIRCWRNQANNPRLTFLFWESECIVLWVHSPNEYARINNVLRGAKHWLTHTYLSVTFAPTHLCTSCVTVKQGTVAAQQPSAPRRLQQVWCRRKINEVRRWSLCRTFISSHITIDI